ncbi:MAG: metallophosphoesterase family protein [Thermoleophilaceae bacterium]
MSSSTPATSSPRTRWRSSRPSDRPSPRCTATSTPGTSGSAFRRPASSRWAGVRIGMVHDAGPARARLGRMSRRFPDADAVVFGHSHIPLHEEDDDGFQIFNPGSPTDRRRQPHHTMGLARAEGGRLRFEHVVLD